MNETELTIHKHELYVPSQGQKRENVPSKYVGVRAPNREAIISYIGSLSIDVSEPAILLVVVDPCGARREYPTVEDIPAESDPSTCGNPNHWFIKYEGAH